MLSFNDGKIHEQVQIQGEFPPIKLDRIPNTTQYVAPSAEIKKLRHEKVRYHFLIDQQPQQELINEYNRYKPEKLEWEGTPYLHAATDPSPEILIYVIPGNPGLCEYYTELVEALARLVPRSQVVALSYAGFDLGPAGGGGGGVIGLDQQVDHKLRFLQHFYEGMRNKPQHVVVLGHSVGAWIAQRVAVRNKIVGFVGLLTPTIYNIAKSERGEQFTKATKYFGALSCYFGVWALNRIPLSGRLISSVVSKLMPENEVSEEAQTASVRLAQSPQACYQLVGMAEEEMKRIGDDIEPKDIKGFWDSCHIWGCFAREDHWVSVETRETILEHCRQKPNVRLEAVSIPHAFCLRDSEAVAGLAAQQINEWSSRSRRSSL